MAYILAERGIRNVSENPATYGILVLLLFLGEVRSIRLFRGSSGGEITISTPFIFALLIKFGLGATIVGVLLASLAADIVHRKAPVKAAFNAAQYVCALTAAGLVLRMLSGGRQLMTEPELAAADLGLLLLVGSVFFVLNVVLPGIAVALDQGIRPLTIMRRDLTYQLATAGVLTAVAPVIILAAQHSLLLMPTSLLPAVAVYWSSRISLQNEHQSLHDSLTGLPNRLLLQHHMADVMTESDMTIVMLLDLDHFKEVNDTLGHRMGDRLLIQVAQRLNDVIDGTGIVARLGGDEFALVLPATGDQQEAMDVAGTVVSRLTQPFEVDDYVLSVDASVGVALYPEHGRDSDTLLRCADVAMYVAKEGRLGTQMYSEDRDRHSEERLALIGEIRRAIDAEEFVLHFQPKVDLRSGRLVGVEALVRWQHPDRGLLPPMEFVPLIERTIHVGSFTMHVIAMALRQSKLWQQAGLTVPVAVNVPVTALHDSRFPDKVAERLKVTGVPAVALELEITESTIMADPARAMTALHRLHNMGIALAVDDFGTGHSSLAYLKQMPVQTLKIDKSFVTGVANDADDRSIAHSTVILARGLGLTTVAEGIEDEAAMTILRDMGCEQAQGFHISRPVPAVELLSWARRQGPQSAEFLERLLEPAPNHAMAAAAARESAS